MKKLIVVCLLGLLVSGCTIKTDYEMDSWDRALYASAHVANIADGVTTVAALNTPGTYESNPIMGRHPSDGEIAAFKTIGALVIYYLTKKLSPAPRKIVLGGFTLLYGSAAINNGRF